MVKPVQVKDLPSFRGLLRYARRHRQRAVGLHDQAHRIVFMNAGSFYPLLGGEGDNKRRTPGYLYLPDFHIL